MDFVKHALPREKIDKSDVDCLEGTKVVFKVDKERTESFGVTVT